MFAWIMALLLKLQPQDFAALHLGNMTHLFLRLIASFCGVFGFSIMFNSSVYMAATAACIGAVANTLRLELVDYTGMPSAAAAFIGALTAGLLNRGSFVVCSSDHDYCIVTAWTYFCENTYRPDIPVLLITDYAWVYVQRQCQ